VPKQRNIEALTEILLEALPQPNVQTPALVAAVAKALAESLARRGVIVPSSLTDDELLACEVDQESRQSPTERAEVAAVVRERLERFARGEA
jgi:glycine/serine hydroxymethyltransferase